MVFIMALPNETSMLTHGQIWAAIDSLAGRNGLSVSGLAKRAGLDPTTFNKSKRMSRDGRLRWPSTESISKILSSTRMDLDGFISLIQADRPPRSSRVLPLVTYSKFLTAFDAAGNPTGEDWDEIEFPDLPIDLVFAIELDSDALLPMYRENDILIASPTVPVRRGDRVLIRLKNDDLVAGILKRKTNRTIDIDLPKRGAAERNYAVVDVISVNRILWASQ